jgi:hypothetical protein
VPAGSVDIARRLAAENQVNVAEIWSYHTIGDQTRFTMVHRTPTPEPRRAPAEKASRVVAKSRSAKPAVRKAPVRPVRAAKAPAPKAPARAQKRK